MTTQFEIDRALMAGAAYFSTRQEINRIPIPQGWTERTEFRVNGDSSGFEAISFQRGNEIVISYAGTNPNDGIFPFPGPDNQANIGLANGVGSVQLQQAAQYYLQVQEANPNATISFTGHSLGGGLAALMGVFSASKRSRSTKRHLPIRRRPVSSRRMWRQIPRPTCLPKAIVKQRYKG